MIKELDSSIRKYDQTPMENINEIVRRIASDGISSKQSFTLLAACRAASHDHNQNDIMDKVWNQLSQSEHLLSFEHYKEMMKFHSYLGNPTKTQELFDKLSQIGYNHDS